jgi:phosphoribosylglycinamide formyltransferase-1
LSDERTPQPIVVLISGRGSNMRALVEHSRADTRAYEVVRVLSDKPAAPGLALARDLGVAAAAVPASGGAAGNPPGRAEYDRKLAAAIDQCAPALIVLAGFMRILSPEFVSRYAGRILNIHPSLLPKYPGLHTHRAVLAAGDTLHGATVHFVTAELDGGPPIIQAKVQVRPDDDEATLAARVQAEEHHIYPLAVGWYCEGRLRCREGRAWLDGAPLLTPVQYVSDTSPAGALSGGAPQGGAASRSRRETGS